jgi:hypothetical protein
MKTFLKKKETKVKPKLFFRTLFVGKLLFFPDPTFVPFYISALIVVDKDV